MSSPLFTVFTPTFNRAHTLGRVYESLVRQTVRDFEWVIVDDGSTDDTRALIEGLRPGAAFPIRYEYQVNQGKNAAFNAGVRLTQGELFVPLDSDDELLPDGLQTLLDAWHRCPRAERHNFSGVTGLCVDVKGNIVGDKFPHSPLDSNTLEAIYRFKIRGEKQGFIRTAVLREFPFPAVEGAKYIPETVIWTAIGRKYTTRFINDAVRIYHQDTGNQITTRHAAAHAHGKVFWYRSVLNDQIDYFRLAPTQFLGAAVYYVRFSMHIGKGHAIWSQLKNPWARTLVFFALPVSLAVYIRDKVASRPN